MKSCCVLYSPVMAATMSTASPNACGGRSQHSHTAWAWPCSLPLVSHTWNLLSGSIISPLVAFGEVGLFPEEKIVTFHLLILLVKDHSRKVSLTVIPRYLLLRRSETTGDYLVVLMYENFKWMKVVWLWFIYWMSYHGAKPKLLITAQYNFFLLIVSSSNILLFFLC